MIKQHITNRGFTLIEVMVALVIFAIGMMGLASLQSVSIRTNYESNARSQAILLAYDMSDRMKANINCSTNPCITAVLDAADRAAWLAQVQNLLPGGVGTIIATPGGGANDFDITVHWDEDRTGAAGLNCPPQDANDLRCFQLSVSL